MVENSVRILKKLRKNELFLAAPSETYSKAWIRDNVYTCLGLEKRDFELVKKTFHKLLDIFLKHEYKINHAIQKKPEHSYQYIHARFDPGTLEEFHEEWGNKQNDAIGLFLFKIGDLEKKGLKILRNIHDYRIVQKLVFYLESIEYWQDKDNGMWEESEEVHASSVGACLAGLQMVKDLVYVPSHLIEKGQESLHKLLPKESETKDVDLALLSLIYPYNIVTEEQKKLILENVEKYLVKEEGVIRYVGDKYFHKEGEAQWTMGFPWLALIYKDFNKEKFEFYLQKTKEVMTEKNELPELYFADFSGYNENTPLAWSQSLYVAAVG